jgi:hypothetical protein
MNLQGIVAVSGKPGLWRALAQNKTGYILESLDAAKTKLVANLSTAKIAALHEITLFGEHEDLKLLDIFEHMKNSASIPDAKADGKKLREFFRVVAPDHDEEKVYASDMKKVVTWFQLLKEFPFFNEPDPAAAVEEKAAVQAAPVTKEEPVTEAKKPAKKATVKEVAEVAVEEPAKPKAKKPAAAKK